MRVKEVTEDAMVVEFTGSCGKRLERFSFPLQERANVREESSEMATA